MLDQYHYDYETDSYYCYPGTYILKNKLNIIDENELKDAERSITSLRTAQLIQNPLDGDLDFNYLKNIHKFIFELSIFQKEIHFVDVNLLKNKWNL